MSNSTETYVKHINPDSLAKNRAFSQVIAVSGSARTVYVGGQDAVDSAGNIIGKGDIKKQAEQVLQNLQIALAAADAKLEHIVKWNVYMVQGQSLRSGFEAFQKTWGNRPNPPTISVIVVAGLANPDFLIEMDAIAIVPD